LAEHVIAVGQVAAVANTLVVQSSWQRPDTHISIAVNPLPSGSGQSSSIEHAGAHTWSAVPRNGVSDSRQVDPVRQSASTVVTVQPA
jgi:hypothetical protein